MSDATLRRLLKNALSGRKAPEGVCERILARTRRRNGVLLLSAAAAAAVIALAFGLFAVSPPPVEESKPTLSPKLATMLKEHQDAYVPIEGPASDSPDDVATIIRRATRRTVRMPGLRDAGFDVLHAHRCRDIDRCAHVVYKNYWLQVSCFVTPAGEIDLKGGTRMEKDGIELTTFRHDKTSIVALQEGDVTKLWMADLRPEQLGRIAVDAEQKRHHLQKTTFQIAHHRCVHRPMEALLLKTPGIEHVDMNEETEEAEIYFDDRRVSSDQITAMLVLNGIEAHPMPSGE